jgi:citrate lyase beta subunit
MLFVQVVHKAGSSSQVPVSDAHQVAAEVQEGDVLQLSHKKKEKDMVRKKKDIITHTLRVQLTRGR